MTKRSDRPASRKTASAATRRNFTRTVLITLHAEPSSQRDHTASRRPHVWAPDYCLAVLRGHRPASGKPVRRWPVTSNRQSERAASGRGSRSIHPRKAEYCRWREQNVAIPASCAGIRASIVVRSSSTSLTSTSATCGRSVSGKRSPIGDREPSRRRCRGCLCFAAPLLPSGGGCHSGYCPWLFVCL